MLWQQIWVRKKSWRHEERCTAILFGSTLVLTVYAPASSKDMDLYEACVPSSVKGAEEVQKSFTSLATSKWSWGDMY